MSGRPPLDDGAIRAMLEARADRAKLMRPDVREIVAAAGARARRPLLGWGVGPRLTWAGGVAAMALAVAIVLAQPLLRQQGANPTPSETSSANATSSSAASTIPTTRPALTPLHLLTPAEAGAVITTASATHSGALIAVQGRLETIGTRQCPVTGTACGSTILADAGSTIMVRPVGDIGPGPWDGSGPLEGALILRLDPRIENDLHVAEFVGLLTTPPTGAPAWFVQDILEGSITQEGAYAAVQGWLVRDALRPCASDPRNPPVSYGCPTDDWLSEDEFQPLQPDGSSLGPPAAMTLSSGSYDAWAADPAAGGPDGRGVDPREGTYLMWLVSDGCGPNADCLAPPPRWRIVGRFDLIEQVAGVARSPDPVVATDGRVPPPDGNAWTVAQMLDRPMGDGDFLVRGWLVATPALRCHEELPLPSGEAGYGCSEVDWLTDEAFQPWVANGTDGGTRAPTVGLPVQNGAYLGFAPSPASADGGGLAPSFGDWIVRETTRGLPCPLGNACPIPTIHWEVVERLPDHVMPISPGKLILPTLPPGVTPAPNGDTPCVPAPGPCG